MVSPGSVDAINGNSGVERQDQAEKAEEQAKSHSRAAFQKSTDAEGDKKRPKKHDRRHRVALRFRESVKHPAELYQGAARYNKCPRMAYDNAGLLLFSWRDQQ